MLDLLPTILEFAGDRVALETLKWYIPKSVYHEFVDMGHATLVYGKVQAGKTTQVLSILKQTPHLCILLIQNSRLVRLQYAQRMQGMSFQWVTNSMVLTANILVVMNNSWQTNQVMSMKLPPYTIICDEADITCTNPLCANAMNLYYVTATPQCKQLRKACDRVQVVTPPAQYKGIGDLCVKITPPYLQLMHEFLVEPGVMLINEHVRIAQMEACAQELSRIAPQVPIVLLSTHRRVWEGGRVRSLPDTTLTALFDMFPERNVVFVANRMSSRGMSYVNADRTRHITHQVSRMGPYRGFMQKSRICGIYEDTRTLTLYLPSLENFDAILNQAENSRLSRYLRPPRNTPLYRIPRQEVNVLL